jgi:aminopeptidase-like protein
VSAVGEDIHALARRLWPINRSLTGAGLRQTLAVIKEICPALTLHDVPSGARAFDWTVPEEWEISAARLIGPDGRTVVDFAENNLHVVGYSRGVDETLSLDDLQPHLHSLPEQPSAIPYVTSYYADRWGFCLPHAQRERLRPGRYRALIEARKFPGALTYGELILPGASAQEIFLSTYVCHPSMANNELSGPCVTAHLARWLASAPRRYTYRIVFIPETIGSIVYLSRHLDHLKANVFAGFNITCVGDERGYSYLPSRAGDTPSDRAARHVLKHIDAKHRRYSWLDRGSDERQYCAPGVDLPIATIMRSKYGEYPEYHTSLDDLDNVVTPVGLQGGYEALRRAIEALERDCAPRATTLCEPQLGKRGLYPTLSTKSSGASVRTMMNLLSLADGGTGLIDIAERCGVPVWDLYGPLDALVEHGLLTTSQDASPSP